MNEFENGSIGFNINKSHIKKAHDDEIVVVEINETDMHDVLDPKPDFPKGRGIGKKVIGKRVNVNFKPISHTVA